MMYELDPNGRAPQYPSWYIVLLVVILACAFAQAWWG